jgi:hypothetical protein
MATITVTQGDASPDPLNIDHCSIETIIFNNTDGTDYLIGLQRRGNSKHDPICIVLSSYGSVTLQANPNDCDATCLYRLLDANGQPVSSLDHGHSIIIGSGRESLKSRKLRKPIKSRKSRGSSKPRR